MPGLPDRVVRDAYSHEVSSCGFWPGGPGMDAMFYSYAYPEPPGFAEYPITPARPRTTSRLGEFVLPYEAMRQSADPDEALLEFLQSTYDAAADCGQWDRAALEVDPAPYEVKHSSYLVDNASTGLFDAVLHRRYGTRGIQAPRCSSASAARASSA